MAATVAVPVASAVPAAVVAVAVAVAIAGCGAGRQRHRVVARGTLAYAVAPSAAGLVSVELDERFALLVRPADGADGSPPRARVDLGPPDHDLPALAVSGHHAYVGGADRAVRRVDLTTARITATWPVGATVTALAATPDLIAIGDASGALCLRRARDGALLQCVVTGTAPITALTLVANRLITTAGGSSVGWRLPSLRRSGPVPSPRPVWANAELVIRGRTVDGVARGRRRRLATMDGQVRAIAVLPDGGLAIAAWVRQLDNPSIIVLAPLD